MVQSDSTRVYEARDRGSTPLAGSGGNTDRVALETGLEHAFPKHKVAGSNPVVVSRRVSISDHYTRLSTERGGFDSRTRLAARMVQWTAHDPPKVEMRVRFSLRAPTTLVLIVARTVANREARERNPDVVPHSLQRLVC